MSKSPAKIKTTVIEDSSEHNRLGKTYIIDAQVAGIGPSGQIREAISGGTFSS